MKSIRRPKLGRRWLLAAISTLGALGLIAGTAAATTTPLTNVNGYFDATAEVQTKGPPCAAYSDYSVTLNSTSAMIGTYTGPVTFTASSTPGLYWGENPAGTFLPLTPDKTKVKCKWGNGIPPYPPTDPISGFTGTLTGTNSSGQTLNCVFTGTDPAKLATYQRGGNRPNEEGLDIVFNGILTGGLACGGLVNEPFQVRTSIVLANTPGGTACNSLYAPTHCDLGPARFTTL